MYKPSNNHFSKLPHPLGYYWNTVIPSTLSDALSYDEMFAKLLYTVNQIIENQYLTVPYLISTNFQYTTESITIRGILYQDYTAIECNQEFTINGMADGTYYINVFNDSLNKAVGVPKETSDTLYLSTEYMPMNSTTLYIFNVVGGKIDGDSIKYNDLYCHMHNIDPEAHKELFDAVNARIDKEIQDRTEADSTLQDNIDAEEAARIAADNTLQSNIDTEESERKQADTQLQNNINAEIKNRQDEDTALHEAIASEASARQAEDEALAGQIAEETEQRQQQDTALNNTINNHIENKNNPHSVTKAQVGLGNVANTAQISSINGVTPTAAGDVTFESSDGSVTFTEGENSIDVKAVGGGSGVAGVSSLQGLRGAIFFPNSSGSNWAVDGQNIRLSIFSPLTRGDLNRVAPPRLYSLSCMDEYTNIPTGTNATGWIMLFRYSNVINTDNYDMTLIGNQGVYVACNVVPGSDIRDTWKNVSNLGVSSFAGLTGDITISSVTGLEWHTSTNSISTEYICTYYNQDLNPNIPQNRAYKLKNTETYTNIPDGEPATGWAFLVHANNDSEPTKRNILLIGEHGIFLAQDVQKNSDISGSWVKLTGGNGVTALTVNGTPRTGNIKVTGNPGILVGFTEADNGLTLTNTGVTAVNSKTGNVNITTGTGILSTPVEDGIMFSNTGVTSLLVNDDSLATAVYVKGQGGISVGTSASTVSGRTDTLNITGNPVNEFTNIQLVKMNEDAPDITTQLFRAFTEEDTQGQFSFSMYGGSPQTVLQANTEIYSLPVGWYFTNEHYIPMLGIPTTTGGTIMRWYLKTNSAKNALQISGTNIPADIALIIPQYTCEIYKDA